MALSHSFNRPFLNLFCIFISADRAKAIKTKAVVNESPTEKLIRELREENQRLLDQLKNAGQPIMIPGEPGEPQMVGVSEDGRVLHCIQSIIHLLIYQSSVHLSNHLYSTKPSIHPFIHPSVPVPSIHLAVRFSFRPCFRFSIRFFLHQCSTVFFPLLSYRFSIPHRV